MLGIIIVKHRLSDVDPARHTLCAVSHDVFEMLDIIIVEFSETTDLHSPSSLQLSASLVSTIPSIGYMPF